MGRREWTELKEVGQNLSFIPKCFKAFLSLNYSVKGNQGRSGPLTRSTYRSPHLPDGWMEYLDKINPFVVVVLVLEISFCFRVEQFAGSCNFNGIYYSAEYRAISTMERH